MRKFLHVNDMVAESLFALELDEDVYHENTQTMLSHIKVGTGVVCMICELAERIKRVVRFKGLLTFDTSKPDGAPRKLLDVSRLKSMAGNIVFHLKRA